MQCSIFKTVEVVTAPMLHLLLRGGNTGYLYPYISMDIDISIALQIWILYYFLFCYKSPLQSILLGEISVNKLTPLTIEVIN